MASIFATALTFPSYSNPTNVSTTLVALTGTLTVPDPGFAWTPIVMGSVTFEADGTVETGTSTSGTAYAYLAAQVDVRMGNTNSGTLVASGSGNGHPSGAAAYKGINSTSALRWMSHNTSGLVQVAQQYAANTSGAPSYTGSQTLTAWIKKVSGTNNIDVVSGTTNLMVYILPTT